MEKDSMVETINTLLQQDTEAQEKLRAAQLQKNQMADTISRKKEEIQKEYSDKAQAAITEYRGRMEQKFQKQIAAIDKVQQDALEKLEKDYQENREHWVDTLVKRCLQ